MMKVAIIGGGISAGTLLGFLREEPEINVVALVEASTDSPGVILANKWNIPVIKDITLLRQFIPDIVVNLSDDPSISERLKREFQDTEIVGPDMARFLLLTGGKTRSLKSEYSECIQSLAKLDALSLEIFDLPDLESASSRILDAVSDITGSSGGFVAMEVSPGSYSLIVSKGLSKGFIDEKNWLIPEDIMEDTIRKGLPFMVRDTVLNEAFKRDIFLREGVRAFIIYPLKRARLIKGYIFIFDRKQRDFSQKDKFAIGLVASMLSVLTDRFDMFKVLEMKWKEFEDASKGFRESIIKKMEELQKTNTELERMNILKSRFISNMSHELRTPLNTILGFSEVLLEKAFGDLTEEQERYVKNIQNAGKYLLELVNNVLDISKIESGKFDMIYETFSISQLLEEVMKTLEPLYSKKSIEPRIEIEPDIEMITADNVKLRQIFYNLLHNAIKFTPDGGKIGVTVKKEINSGRYAWLSPGEEVMICSVWDTGIGIKPEDRERIFDEFEQVDSSLSRQSGGAGLGLALTKKLVELHGGVINVESTPGKGSTFTFMIPVAHREKVPLVLEEVKAPDMAYPWLKEEAPLILIVEDDLLTVELLTIHLTQAGYRVAHAYDGVEGLEKVRSLRPFAVILDIMIPRKDGWEVLQELKADEEVSHIPVIIHSIIDNRELAFALGATDYLLKPLDREALMEKLGNLTSSVDRRRSVNSVLIVDSSESEREELKRIISGTGFNIFEAEQGKNGIEIATSHKPSVILVNMDLPDMSGFDIVRYLKDKPDTKDIPIFLLTEKNVSIEERLELLGRIERIIKKSALGTKDLIDHIRELELIYPRKAGLIDDLTGLFNHRYLMLRLAQELERAQRYNLPLNLLILDVDHFGKYVSERGQYYGNLILKKIAELLKRNIRGSDVLVRYGGDSFAIIFPSTTLESARSLGNRFTAIIKNYPFLYTESFPKGRLTVSVGLAHFPGAPDVDTTETAENMISCAESALHDAIGMGGDRVEVYSPKK